VIGTRRIVKRRKGATKRGLQLPPLAHDAQPFDPERPQSEPARQREPEIHGPDAPAIEAMGGVARRRVERRQSNGEGELVAGVQQFPGLALNAGAYSHTSIALLDALRASNEPLIEVHLSNIYQRESFRQHSYVSLAAEGTIRGFGVRGYLMAPGALVAKWHNAH
jgi:3-dehydroquinate dehydratase II